MADTLLVATGTSSPPLPGGGGGRCLGSDDVLEVKQGLVAAAADSALEGGRGQAELPDLVVSRRSACAYGKIRVCGEVFTL